jgi:hypothetical protein
VSYADLKRLLGRELTDAEIGIVVTAKVTGDQRPIPTILQAAARQRPLGAN